MTSEQHAGAGGGDLRSSVFRELLRVELEQRRQQRPKEAPDPDRYRSWSSDHAELVDSLSTQGYSLFSLATSELEWIDQALDRFDRAWKGVGSPDQRPQIEEYLGETTFTARSVLLRWLLELDLDYRRQQGEQPTPEEYERRFPRHTELIRDTFAALFPRPSGGWPVIPRYTIEREIGHGGMGDVYRARDEQLGRTLAVKVLQEKHQHNGDLQSRFLEEARLTGQLQHPGIPPLHELGTTCDDRPFFSMKLVKGQTLADLLRGRKDPGEELSRFVSMFLQVCQTVAYAHAHRVIHRDLKPSNIMVGAFGEVQVMDWGLAKVVTGEGPTEEGVEGASTIRTGRPAGEEPGTEPGSVLGTWQFMAPEQARGETHRLDERCDVFGLGAVLSVILTGEPPYTETRDLARRGDLAAAMERLDACRADAELVGLCKECLAAERNDRPRHAGMVATGVADYQAAVQERLRQAELRQAQASERLLGNAFAAQMVAGSLLLKWRLMSSALERASRDPQLRILLRDEDRDGLEQFLRSTFAENENEALFKTWYIFNDEGTLVGYWPANPTDQEVIGRSYAGRDYFLGARRKGPGSPVHVSRVFKSLADGMHKVALSTAIRDPDRPGDGCRGVITVSITTGPVLGLPQPRDNQRKAVLVGRLDTADPRTADLEEPQEREYLILVHPAYRVGQEPVESNTRKLRVLLEREHSSDEFQVWDAAHLGNPEDYRDEDYRDPVAGQDGALAGRWLAGFAPVGNTEFVVIVQQRYDDT